MHQNLIQGLTNEMTIEEKFNKIWNNSITSNLKHPEYLTYREQFEQTTMIKKIKMEEFQSFQLIENLLKQGIKQGIIKDLPLPILTAFAFIPIITLIRYHISGIIKMDEKQIKKSCEIAWNTIKK